jgi:hypothetical protein
MGKVIRLPTRAAVATVTTQAQPIPVGVLPSVIDAYTVLPAAETLPALRKQAEAALRPASCLEVAQIVALLGASFKSADVFEDRNAFGLAMIEELGDCPADVLHEAMRTARRTLKWFPSIAEIVTICDGLMAGRRADLHTISRIEHEHARRQAEQERRRAEEAEAQRRVAELQARIRRRFGEEAPTPDDIELACAARPIFYRDGVLATILGALDEGEPWAATLCRRLALAWRAKRAAGKGLVDAERAVAIAQLAIGDEAQARRQLEQIEAAPVVPIAIIDSSSADFRSVIDAILAAAGCCCAYRNILSPRRGIATHVERDHRPLPDLTAELAAFRERMAAISVPAAEAASAGEG